MDNSFQFIQDNNQSSVLLTFAATITTRTRGFDTPSEVAGDGFKCDKDGALNPREFLDKCGTKYLAREDLGGFIMFSLRFDSLSKEQKIFFQNKSSVGIKGAKVDLGVTVNQLKKVLGEKHEVFVWTHGFTAPPVKVTGGDALTLQELLTFVTNLQPEDGTAVMRQVFENYHSYQFKACGVEATVLDGLNCSVDFYLNQDNIRGDISLKHRLDLLHHIADFPKKYRFFGASESDVKTFLQDTKQCQHAYANGVGICDAAMQNGEFDALCKACEIPKIGDFGCEYRSLDGRADGLLAEITPVFVAPENFDPGNKTANRCDGLPCVITELAVNQGEPALLYRKDLLCTFSGMTGHFAGNAESVRIEPSVDGVGNSTWSIKVKSGRKDAEEQIKGYFHCSHKGAFHQKSGAIKMQEPIFASLRESIYPSLPPGPKGLFLTGISGVKGKMEGFGEYVRYDEHDEVFVKSQQGYLRGYFTSFGPLNSKGGRANLAPNLNGVTFSAETKEGNHHIEKKLTHSDLTHCYITEIAGDFDGHAEAVKLWIGEDRFWRMTVRASSKPKFVRGKARCVKYDQNP